jgi:sodium transport system permease protein
MKNSVIGIVFKKELVDTFRDKKTIIVSILLPLILFPVLFWFMGNSMDKTVSQVENNMKVAIVDSGNSKFGEYLKKQTILKNTESSNVSEDVKSGKILMSIEIPKDFDTIVDKDMVSKILLTYDNSSQQSQMAMEKVNVLIGKYTQNIVAERLSKRNVNPEILNPIQIETKTSVKESEGNSKFMLSLLLPLMLFIYSVTGPMGAAVDLGAGEKERGTLEPLLTTRADRLSLLWGKFLAITVVGLMTTLASIGGLLIAMNQKGGMFKGGSGAGVGMSITSLLLIGLVAVLVTMVFGALELSISIYARSFKEAQTYVTPLMIIGFIPAYATYMLDAKNIEMVYFHIPLANAVCLMKEFIVGIYNYTHIGITLGWMIVYIVASILFARYMFSREDVIFRT